MNIYQEELLDHYENPSNYGTLPNPDISHEEDNPLCGDRIRMDLLVENDIIKEVRFSGHGCTISLAAASMLTEKIEGKSLTEIKQITRDDIMDMIGIPLGPVRVKCALLALKVLKAGAYGIKGWPGEEDE
ncbi:SUF system NifU family Fe-S cluster assembly protein [Candidatus Poribacteria bacterium]|nr:SUF system NifU family Fe-S cluster assembly protein [Candidatus Poribacteria bacterium]MYF54299.1 SUF system NifU family Fe-S cluster assembly protein [Candidatus Poribacteria bacterium]